MVSGLGSLRRRRGAPSVEGSVEDEDSGGEVVLALSNAESGASILLAASVVASTALSGLATRLSLFIGVFEGMSEAHRLVNDCGIEAAGAGE